MQKSTLSTKTFCLVLAGIMVALGTVLSFVKIFHLPYGGAITLCSMLPVSFFAYRSGIKWGLGAGAVFAVLQLLFGLDALKGISGVQVAGSIVLDYILAFGVLGLCGVFRGKLKSDALSFTLGLLVCGLLRYLCSFLSGWLLWSAYADANFSPVLAGMSGNMLAALYSLLYNGSYMVPEILLTCAAGFLLIKLTGKRLLSDSRTVGEGPRSA